MGELQLCGDDRGGVGLNRNIENANIVEDEVQAKELTWRRT